MLNALRLNEGFMVDEYVARTGLPVATVEDRLTLAAQKGMIEPLDGAGWRPTTLGLRFQNDLTAAFLP